MEKLPKYERWLQEALRLLSEDFFEGTFRPECECDVQCHLYACLHKAKDNLKKKRVTLTTQHRVCAELRAGRDRIDLAVYKSNRRALKLLIEIKIHAGDLLTTDKIVAKVKRDVKKMRSWKQKSSFPKAARDPVVFFFFTGADRQRGVGEIVRRNMDTLRRMYADEEVTFEWGPRLYENQ